MLELQIDVGTTWVQTWMQILEAAKAGEPKLKTFLRESLDAAKQLAVQAAAEAAEPEHVETDAALVAPSEGAAHEKEGVMSVKDILSGFSDSLCLVRSRSLVLSACGIKHACICRLVVAIASACFATFHVIGSRSLLTKATTSLKSPRASLARRWCRSLSPT